ncbi:glycosyltransferase family 2 protein [Salimicrobium humidisoli]|uniref:Glycosyl transferase family 2 n=1 Tax=Salimicrobium humidisoli TaxID=2029857 RepID=A0ABX4HTC4_9BACI|nr:glycosyltransferase family 2 protein [Salimicrobium humidisoli]PBB06458.1 glycosyl transferase family 2 [Salimicrobium humidisoli]
MPFFSVIMPCFNKEKYIYDALESVINQSFENFEVIIVDDGSTDNSLNVVSTIDDKRIKIINQKNEGVSAARNRGIKFAKGEYIAFLDADDFWSDIHLLNIYNMINEFPGCGLYCTAYDRVVNGKKKSSRFKNMPAKDNKIYLINDYFEESTLGNNIAWTSAVVVPRNVLLEVGGFPEGVNRGEDRYVWGVIALTYKVVFYNYPTAFYRIIDTGLTSSEDINIHWIFEDYINNLKHSEISSEQLENIHIYLLERRLSFVIPLFKNKQYQKSFKTLLNSFKYGKLRPKAFEILIRLLLRR